MVRGVRWLEGAAAVVALVLLVLELLAGLVLVEYDAPSR